MTIEKSKAVHKQKYITTGNTDRTRDNTVHTKSSVHQ